MSICIVCKKIIYLIIFNVIFSFYNFSFDENIFVLHTNPIQPVVPLKIHVIDWELVILKILQNVFFFNNIENDNVLLVNIVKNNTNGSIQVNKITNLLIDCILKNTKKYKVICMEELYRIYRELGVFPEDHINSYDFSINIANFLQANYILYSIISGDATCPILELQLIFVKTGEILCIINEAVCDKIIYTN